MPLINEMTALILPILDDNSTREAGPTWFPSGLPIGRVKRPRSARGRQHHSYPRERRLKPAPAVQE